MSDANPGTGGSDGGPPLPLPVTNAGGPSHPILDEVGDSPSSGSPSETELPGILPLVLDGSTASPPTMRDLILPPAPSSTTMADTSGGGYRFSPEQLENIIDQWEDLRDSLQDDRDMADKLRSVQAPGHEFASEDFVQQANSSGEAHYQLHIGMLSYVEQYIEKLKDARSALGAAEDHAAQDITQAGAQQS